MAQSNKMKLANNRGFTMVELAVVIAILGVIAAFGVPRFKDSVERTKASEALTFLTSLRSAQESYHSRNGTYSTDITLLDVKVSAPRYFTVGAPVAGSTGNIQSSWRQTLTRVGASAGYGAYTVVYGDNGYEAGTSTINSLTTINPMQ